MGRINCRTGCGATRSNTVISSDGEHISKCFNCGDEEYIDPLDDELIHIAGLTPSGYAPLCDQPLLDGTLVGNELGDDISKATCSQCVGLYAKLEVKASEWED